MSIKKFRGKFFDFGMDLYYDFFFGKKSAYPLEFLNLYHYCPGYFIIDKSLHLNYHNLERGEKMEPVEVKLKRLPQNLKKEVEDFVDFLLEKRNKKIRKKPTLDWIGGLKEFKDQYTSLELQKKANEWRT